MMECGFTPSDGFTSSSPHTFHRKKFIRGAINSNSPKEQFTAGQFTAKNLKVIKFRISSPQKI
jgi:hypothetical protein